MSKTIYSYPAVGPSFHSDPLAVHSIQRGAQTAVQYDFVGTENAPQVTDRQDRFKSLLKRYPRFYGFLVSVISPVLLRGSMIRRFERDANGLVLNVGSGNQRLAKRHLNVDFFAYPEVDVIADLHALPFPDRSVDAVLNIAVLEHVRNPDQAVAEMYRVLKPGGYVLSLIPFMQPYHASPHDYQRYTVSGIRELHRAFDVIEVCPAGGPVSGFLWTLQEFMAVLFSFGIPALRDYLVILFMLISWPLKYLDLVFRTLPTAHNIASSFYFYGRKPASGEKGR